MGKISNSINKENISVKLVRKFLVILSLILLFPLQNSNAQNCLTQFCKIDDLGKDFDYRGQSTYAKFSPNDTCRVQAILYSGNEIRIMTCSDPKLGNVQFKVFKSIREYKRILDRIEKKDNQEPIYKLDKKGNPIPKLDDWGKPIRDNVGEIQFEIVNYKKTIIIDTIWKIERKTKEEILFDSRKGVKIFTTVISKTEPISIEMVVPKTTDPKLIQYKGCIGIMIGRIFKSTNFKGFSK